MIPSVLLEIQNCLREEGLILTQGRSDARLDSADSENAVISTLQNKNRWSVYSPNMGKKHNRSWYDVRINNEFYIDIKISNLDGRDNTNAKTAIYYLLTGKDPDNVTPQVSKFFSEMKRNQNLCEKRDFYYLIISKKKEKRTDVFIVSLKGIANCHTAPNNLPFQAKWDECREPKERSWEEAKDFLLGKWAESIRKAIELHWGGMPQQYPEFFKNMGTVSGAHEERQDG